MRELKQGLLEVFQKRVAETAVGPSALRNQGNEGVVSQTREHLKTLDLATFVKPSERRFRAVLDRETEALRRSLPARAKHWGTARKALNLFLRDVLYHRYLCDHYRFSRIEDWLEVPLDSNVAEGLAEAYLDDLPPWPGIKYLRANQSLIYQQAARRVALSADISPVHLDVYWWRNVGRGQVQPRRTRK
jgi:hypothetical protein